MDSEESEESEDSEDSEGNEESEESEESRESGAVCVCVCVCLCDDQERSKGGSARNNSDAVFSSTGPPRLDAVSLATRRTREPMSTPAASVGAAKMLKLV